MTITSYTPRYGVRGLCALLACTLSALGAQENLPSSPAPQEQSDTLRDKLTHQIGVLSEKIRVAEEQATQERAALLGVEMQALHDHVLRLRETRSVYEDHIDALSDLDEARRALESVQLQIQGYQGLPDPPPYMPWIVDTYRDDVKVRKQRRDAQQKALTLAEEQLAQSRENLARAESALALANEKLLKNTSPAAQQRFEWDVEAAMARRQLNQARTAYAEFMVSLERERLAWRDRELSFAQRRMEEAAAKEVYRPEDLDVRKAAIAQQREALLQEVLTAQARRDADQKRLADVRAALDQATEDEEFAVYQALVELRRSEADLSKERVQLLREQLGFLYYEEEIWTARYRLHLEPKGFALIQQRDRMRDLLDSLAAARHTHETREAALRGEARELTRRIAGIQPGTNDLTKAPDRLKVVNAHLDVYSQSLGAIDGMEDLAGRLLEEIAAEQERLTIGERFTQFRQTAQRIWDQELINLDGRPLTVRKIGAALIIFIVGFSLIRVFKRYLRKALHARSHIDPNAAALIERLAYYAMLALVVLITLQTVSIPLTVFTFLGGALAIGVGFGAQNLINNFISGIILMAERPIKIGDIVEVDGQRGRIAEIGARCSRLSLFSGVDILVPNSSFLEKNVVNWTLADSRIRFTVTVGVDYGAPTREVAKLIAKAVEEHGRILKDPPPVVLFTEFGDNALTFQTDFWLNLAETSDSRMVCSDVRFRIEKLFREAGISIAYPQRDVHLDTTRPLELKIVSTNTEGETREDHPS